MTPRELIATYRKSPNDQLLTGLSTYFRFEPILKDGIAADINFGFRTEVVNELLDSFSFADVQLIRSLFQEEVNCDRATWGHGNLYQLCFYLYSLGQLEDVFILYDAKYNATNMDTGIMLDREAVTVGHEVEEIIAYVESRFNEDPMLINQYPNMLADLKDLQLNPDYDSTATYSQFIKGYFFGHENVSSNKNTSTPYNTQKSEYKVPKPWWRFW